MERTFIEETTCVGQEVRVCGWIHRLRALKTAVFIVLKDCSGSVQIFATPEQLSALNLKLEDVLEVTARVRAEPRVSGGRELQWISGRVLNRSAPVLPFTSASSLESVPTEVQLAHRSLSVRNEAVGETFRVQAAILEGFRAFLRSQRFNEIVTSKLVATGTEGGSNLFEVKYFERAAYLAQSPQFYKEQGVAGLERVFETGHVYRAEPHATSRHLTEYCSLDLELGFVESAEPVMELERRLLSSLFETLNQRFGESIRRRSGAFLPELTRAPIWGVQRVPRAARPGAIRGRPAPPRMSARCVRSPRRSTACPRSSWWGSPSRSARSTPTREERRARPRASTSSSAGSRSRPAVSASTRVRGWRRRSVHEGWRSSRSSHT